jgi:hypothetical protein
MRGQEKPSSSRDPDQRNRTNGTHAKRATWWPRPARCWWRKCRSHAIQPSSTPAFLALAVTRCGHGLSSPTSTPRQQRRKAQRGIVTRRSTTARGYGNAHQALRKRVATVVAAGAAVCWRFGGPIYPGEAFDLGHDDHDRTRYRGPEHVLCNRSAGAASKQHKAKPVRHRLDCGALVIMINKESAERNRCMGWSGDATPLLMM